METSSVKERRTSPSLSRETPLGVFRPRQREPLLQELVAEFPQNSLFVRELAKLGAN
jgi:hypothetical protein